MKTLALTLSLAAIAALFLASSVRTISPETVLGRYQAMMFQAEVGGRVVDLTCIGGSFLVDLTADRVIGGQIVLPDTLALPAVSTNYPGTYTIEGDEVILNPRNTNFGRDSRWRFLVGGILQGEFVHQGVRFRAEFQRQ